MKKSTTLILLVAISLFANAQKNHIGLRYNLLDRPAWSLFYQHQFGEVWQLETDLHLDNSFQTISGIWQYRTKQSLWGIHAVGGLGLGVNHFSNGYLYDQNDPSYYNKFGFSIVSQIGLEYNFKNVPLRLSIDLRPQINITPRGKATPHIGSGIGIAFGFPKTHKDVKQPDMAEFILAPIN